MLFTPLLSLGRWFPPDRCVKSAIREIAFLLIVCSMIKTPKDGGHWNCLRWGFEYPFENATMAFEYISGTKSKKRRSPGAGVFSVRLSASRKPLWVYSAALWILEVNFSKAAVQLIKGGIWLQLDFQGCFYADILPCDFHCLAAFFSSHKATKN